MRHNGAKAKFYSAFVYLPASAVFFGTGNANDLSFPDPCAGFHYGLTAGGADIGVEDPGF